MAGLEELKKQERTLKKRPRTNIPSYSTEDSISLVQKSTNEIVPEPKVEAAAPVKKVQDVPEAPQKLEPENNNKELENKTEDLVVEKEMPINSKPIIPPVSKKKEKVSAEEVVKSVTVRLMDIDDADFLKYACKVHGMNMQEYFWSIIEADIKSNKKINPRDEEHMNFKNVTLPEIRTIPIPKALKEAIGVNAGLHRLPETRYMAMIVHRARMADPGWN